MPSSLSPGSRGVPPDAIVFDFDGVIVNTEPLHLQATQAALATRGLSIEPEEYYDQFVGYNDVEMFEQYAKHRRLEWCSDDLQELIAAKALKFEALERSAAILAPGAVACVRRLAEVSPLAVASGARRVEIERILERVDLRGYFKTVVGAEDTASGKPAPDPYLAAAARLGARPEKSIAIEDTAAGLASARAAGLRCIGLTSTFPASKLSLADLVVASLDEITADVVRSLLDR